MLTGRVNDPHFELGSMDDQELQVDSIYNTWQHVCQAPKAARQSRKACLTMQREDLDCMNSIPEGMTTNIQAAGLAWQWPSHCTIYSLSGS